MDCLYESNEHENQEGHFRNEQPNPRPALSQRLIAPSEEQALVLFFLLSGVYSWTLAQAGLWRF